MKNLDQFGAFKLNVTIAITGGTSNCGSEQLGYNDPETLEKDVSSDDLLPIISPKKGPDVEEQHFTT